MAVNRAKYNEIPKGAKIIGENEALQFQTDLIQRWPNKSDTFAVRYGMYFLYGATMISGIIITRHFRKKFLLYNYGKFMSLIPITIIPATTGIFFHSEFVLRDVVLRKNVCPTCLELRSAAFQTFTGTVFPAILAPMGCASLSQYFGTYNIPNILKEPKVVFTEFGKMFKPFRTKLWYLFLAQAFCGSAVTYLEMRSVMLIDKELFGQSEETELNV
ncbi:transmembrane protein 126 isoform X1 [Rhynchophorus ferrugineus]|uniref:Uncharacterized protein n=1 Tax=Rhynchophorus ferrugineus TaxID=354439 RepID=A0A834I1Q4_RHYFE|nr:hypothetical protein GWI33_015833 [Rhynchophorus ferrugineus]